MPDSCSYLLDIATSRLNLFPNFKSLTPVKRVPTRFWEALGSRRESPGAITDFDKALHNPQCHAHVAIRGQREDDSERARDVHDAIHCA